MTEQEIRDQLAEALATRFVSDIGERNPDWDIDKPDGPDNPYYLTVPMAERVKQSPVTVVVNDDDGFRSIHMLGCDDLAVALLPAVRSIAAAELEAVAAAIDADARVSEARTLGQAQRVAGEARSVVLERADVLRGKS